ncbi:hypothetical protein ABZP36_035500 [Zizania latifolia]
MDDLRILLQPTPAVANGVTEEAVQSILLPLLKEFISSVAVPGQNGSGLGLGMGFGIAGCADIVGLGFGIARLNPEVPSVDKWRQQQILKLEVYLKRIELVRDKVTAMLEELRSSEGCIDCAFVGVFRLLPKPLPTPARIVAKLSPRHSVAPIAVLLPLTAPAAVAVLAFSTASPPALLPFQI